MQHLLSVPPDFAFSATAYSHGWCVLTPFTWHPDRDVLERVIGLPRAPARIAFSQPGGRGTAVAYEVVAGRGTRGGLKKNERARIESMARRMFRLDADLSTFHTLCLRKGGNFARAARAGFGRLLRAPTVFEDVVKILATTNTTWGGTKAMVAKLVAITQRDRAVLGVFPTAREIAGMGAERLAADARWGYRAAYLDDICRRISRGELDLAAWESWSGTTETLEREIRSLPGLGPYAAAHVLALLGRHDRIGVDTVFRSFVWRTYFPRAREAPPDSDLLAVYDDWGSWRSLAYWADLWYANRFESL